MKKLIIVVASATVLAWPTATVQATPLTVGDIYYVGQIVDGIPSSLANEVEYINFLLMLEPGDGDTTFLGSSEIYNREGSTLGGDLPAAVLAGAVKVDDPLNTGINVTGYTYILGKYDASKAGSYVWYVPALTLVDLPAALGSCGGGNGCGLSHYALFTPTSVPDGGATLMLLGGALVGLAVLRRKLGV